MCYPKVLCLPASGRACFTYNLWCWILKMGWIYLYTDLAHRSRLSSQLADGSPSLDVIVTLSSFIACCISKSIGPITYQHLLLAFVIAATRPRRRSSYNYSSRDIKFILLFRWFCFYICIFFKILFLNSWILYIESLLSFCARNPLVTMDSWHIGLAI